ncbi:MAG: hypothetical protein U0586_08765 [Candidatus Brocadiaceae bacterium]
MKTSPYGEGCTVTKLRLPTATKKVEPDPIGRGETRSGSGVVRFLVAVGSEATDN